MPLKDHVAALEALIASTPFVTATSLSYEERPPLAVSSLLSAPGFMLFAF